MLLSHLSQLHSHQGKLHVKREYTKCQIPCHDNAIPAEPSSVLTERVNGRGAPSMGKLETKIDSSSDPCLSDVVYVV